MLVVDPKMRMSAREALDHPVSHLSLLIPLVSLPSSLHLVPVSLPRPLTPSPSHSLPLGIARLADMQWMTNGKATTHDLSTTSNLQSNPFNAKAKFHAAVHVR